MINIDIPSGIKNVKDKASEKNEAVEKFLNDIDNTVSEKTSEVLSSIGKSIEPLIPMLNFAAGVVSKLQIISNLIPNDITTFPSFNLESMFTGGILNSVKQIALAAEIKLKDEANKLKIYVINLGFDALDTLIDRLVESIKNQLLEYIENNCQQFTGYTYVDVLYHCSQGIQLVNQLKEIVSTNKVNIPDKLSKKDKKSAKQQLAEYRENGKKTKGELNEKFQAEDEFAKENLSNEINAKKEEILSYVRKLSPPLYNAFNLIIIKICGEELLNKISAARTTFNPSSLNDAVNITAIITDFLSNNLNIENVQAVSGYALNARASSIDNYVSKSKSISGKNIGISIIDKVQGKIKINIFNDPNSGETQNEMLLKLKEMDLFDIATINNIINESKLFYVNDSPEEVTHISESNGLQYSILFEKKEKDTVEDTTELAKVDITQMLSLEEITMDLNSSKPVSEILQMSLKILLKLLPAINPIATLMSNYKTNKEYVRQFAMRNNEILDKGSKGISNDIEEVDVQGKNSYIIRTQDMYDIFCMVLEKESLNEKDILTVEETKLIVYFLKLHCYDYSVLNEEKETTIFIHIDGGKDGSFYGTNLNYYPSLGKIVIGKSAGDELGSQIMRCLRDSNKAHNRL